MIRNLSILRFNWKISQIDIDLIVMSSGPPDGVTEGDEENIDGCLKCSIL